MKLLSENELGSQDPEEFAELLDLFAKLWPTRFIEIGSMYGWSLQHFIHYAHAPSTAVSIDLSVGEGDWRYEKRKNYVENVWPLWAKMNRCDLHVIEKQSQLPETLVETMAVFDDGFVDFLFIDGGHSYGEVSRDYEMYGPLVRRGGIIAFHDIGDYSCCDGTRQIWREVKEKHDMHAEIVANGTNGIGVVFV